MTTYAALPPIGRFRMGAPFAAGDEGPEPPSPTGVYPDDVWAGGAPAAASLGYGRALDGGDEGDPPSATGVYPDPVWAGGAPATAAGWAAPLARLADPLELAGFDDATIQSLQDWCGRNATGLGGTSMNASTFVGRALQQLFGLGSAPNALPVLIEAIQEVERRGHLGRQNSFRLAFPGSSSARSRTTREWLDEIVSSSDAGWHPIPISFDQGAYAALLLVEKRLLRGSFESLVWCDVENNRLLMTLSRDAAHDDLGPHIRQVLASVRGQLGHEARDYADVLTWRLLP